MGWERASARDGVVRGREWESGGIGDQGPFQQKIH